MEVTDNLDKLKENFFILLDFVRSKVGNVLPQEDSGNASRFQVDFGADVAEKTAEEMNKAIFRRDLIVKLISVASTLAVTFFTVKILRDQLDPTRKEKDKTREKATEMLRRLGVKDVKLTDYELCIAANLVDPLEMTVSWGNIGGLDDVIEQIQDTVIFPFRRNDLFPSSALIQPPKGVLLYGPPGCGKTMIAKATAKAAGARFINLQVSSLLDKWYGESQKRAEAVFSLAMKLQPAIIFIDEIDSFLRSRTGSDHEATLMIKTQFMSFWDGLITKPNCKIMIMGATNRPQDVDAAILRRMPCAFRIGMPGRIQRIAILSLLLEGEEAEGDIDYNNLGDLTDGFSGSDLKEACRVGALNRVHEFVSEARRLHGDDYCDRVQGQIRPMSVDDLEYGLNKVRNSKQTMTESISQFNLD